MACLKDKMRAYPCRLSGGRQQRVARARDYIKRMDIVLAKEPAGDPDEETEQEIEDLFQRDNAKRRNTFVIATDNGDSAGTAKKPTMRTGALSEQRSVRMRPVFSPMKDALLENDKR